MARLRLAPPDGGTLDQRVRLYGRPGVAQDAYGQPETNTGTLIGTFWAGVRVLRAAEKLGAVQLVTIATHLVTMRWLGSAIPTSAGNPHGLILPGMYLIVVLDDSRLDILEADNVQRAQLYWSLTCQQRIVL